jgi:hypothetical protein
MQEPKLLSGTIAENIRLGKPSATQTEIEHAAKLANAHDFILAQPDGYNTEIGEGGATLSGGTMPEGAGERVTWCLRRVCHDIHSVGVHGCAFDLSV